MNKSTDEKLTYFDHVPESKAARWACIFSYIPILGIPFYLILSSLYIILIRWRFHTGFKYISRGGMVLIIVNSLVLIPYFCGYVLRFCGHLPIIPSHGVLITEDKKYSIHDFYRFGEITQTIVYKNNQITRMRYYKNGRWTYQKEWDQNGNLLEEYRYFDDGSYVAKKYNIKTGEITLVKSPADGMIMKILPWGDKPLPKNKKEANIGDYRKEIEDMFPR